MDLNNIEITAFQFPDPGLTFHIQDIVIPQTGINFNLSKDIQFIHLKQGRFYYFQDNQERAVPDNHLIIIPRPGNHGITFANNSILTRIIINQAFFTDIEPLLQQGKFPESFDYQKIIREQRIITYHLNREKNSEVHELLFEMLNEYTRKSSGYKLMIKLKFISLLLLVSRIELDGNPVKIIKSKKHEINDLIKYIQEKFYEDFHLNKMARQCGMNPSYFSRAFRQQTGMPVFQYINHLRIQKACQLLKRSAMPIIDIAYEVGYQNLSFFNRYFRRIMNMSPREYRGMIQK